jgi:hypothetical protein
MSYELKLFLAPGATGTCRRDDGSVIPGHPTTYDDGTVSGRPAVGFTFPDSTPDGNGVQLTVSSAPGISLRAKLYVRTPESTYPWERSQTAAFAIDDLTNLVIPAVPVTPPVTPPDTHPNPNADPLSIILEVEARHQFDLTTKEGCGKFTEACCTELHNRHSNDWGHVRKEPSQNQWNGHGVDAIMLARATPNTPAAIYDIIVNSEAPGAHAAMNFSSSVNLALWYYPA